MSKGTIEFGTVTINGAAIASVEKGNVLDQFVKRENKVIAFSVRPEGFDKNVKLLLKGEKAAQVYDAFLKNGASMDKTENVDGVEISRTVIVSFEASVKEERANELVLHEPQGIVFDYKFEIN